MQIGTFGGKEGPNAAAVNRPPPPRVQSLTTNQGGHMKQGGLLVAGLALTGAIAAACGGGGSNSSSGSGGAAAATKPAAGTGTVINVDEKDFTIGLPSATLQPGTYTFAVKNSGQFPHALEIDGPGVSDQKTTTVTSGGTTSITVTLQKGSYELYCPVGNHKARGMELTLTVA
jgi:plastocyanin